MRIDANTRDNPLFRHALIFDLKTGEKIERVISCDTDTGVLKRHWVNADGSIAVNTEAQALVEITETRSFRKIVDRRDGSEAARTGH